MEDDNNYLDEIIAKAETFLGQGQNQKQTRSKTTRDFAYYQRLRRENKSQYYTSKIQKQLLEDRLKLGQDRFYGGSE